MPQFETLFKSVSLMYLSILRFSFNKVVISSSILQILIDQNLNEIPIFLLSLTNDFNPMNQPNTSWVGLNF